MKAIIFDAGPLITFALNSLLDLVVLLKQKYNGIFYITNAVHEEAIERPSKSRRFGFESMMIKQLLADNYIEQFDTDVYSEETAIITKLANTIYSIKGNSLKILDPGELETLVLAKNINAEAVVVDERTTRLLLENPYRLKKMLEHKFRGNVAIDKEALKEFERHFSTVKIIRSVELALIAVDFGFFKDFLRYDKREDVVRSLLWAFKLNGCSLSEREIKALTKMYRE